MLLQLKYIQLAKITHFACTLAVDDWGKVIAETNNCRSPLGSGKHVQFPLRERAALLLASYPHL